MIGNHSVDDMRQAAMDRTMTAFSEIAELLHDNGIETPLSTILITLCVCISATYLYLRTRSASIERITVDLPPQCDPSWAGEVLEAPSIRVSYH